MIRSYIYNEIKNACTFKELFDIKNKIIRAEHCGHLDSKSVDILLMCCEKQLRRSHNV